MKKMIFPLITEYEQRLPYYVAGVGCCYSQEHIIRPNGYPYYQWIQCHSGKGELIIDGLVQTVSENQAMLLFPEEPHEYYAVGEYWEVDWIIFGGLQIEDFFKRTAGIQKSGVYFVTQSNMILSKICKAYEIEQSDNATKSLECSRITYDILMDILKFSSQKSDSSMVKQYIRIKPLLDFIDKNYYKQLALSDLSEIIGISPEHLCSLFKKATSHRVFEYIIMTRIRKSKELMIQNKQMQIKEVAKLVGFDDVSYFCSMFRKSENMSPNEFKKLHIFN
jgi:AraC-type DNA-binding domain-containing proteins